MFTLGLCIAFIAGTKYWQGRDRRHAIREFSKGVRQGAMDAVSKAGYDHSFYNHDYKAGYAEGYLAGTKHVRTGETHFTIHGDI